MKAKHIWEKYLILIIFLLQATFKPLQLCAEENPSVQVTGSDVQLSFNGTEIHDSGERNSVEKVISGNEGGTESMCASAEMPLAVPVKKDITNHERSPMGRRSASVKDLIRTGKICPNVCHYFPFELSLQINNF